MKFNTESIRVFLKYKLVHWMLYLVVISGCIGSISAFFLWSLDKVGNINEYHPYTLYFMPIGGLIIVFTYQYFNNESAEGNKLIFNSYQNKSNMLPWLMAPLVLLGTLLTHLTGGSAGREGTAVQMGSVIASKLNRIFPTHIIPHHKLLLTLGISAGFAAVFGTPITAAVFAFEMFNRKKRLHLINFPLVLIVAFLAHFTCLAWNVPHTTYAIGLLPVFNITTVLWVGVAAVIFGLIARIFVLNTHFWADFFKQKFPNPYTRIIIGGISLAFLISYYELNRYSGLGIQYISQSFYFEATFFDFILKLLLTGLTLGIGFKGGEVTPLFFVGATLGSFLSFFIPLPIGILAGIGYVSVFSGATKTPVACAIMGVELFGFDGFAFFIIATLIAYFISGKKSIYNHF